MSSVVIGTAGHIDHGKSTLVRALTGIDPDRLKEEQTRGITIDLGFAHVTIGDVQIAFVDVPGHERFVRNMLAGAGGLDAVLLVVAANESVMPQTREHFEICRLLGITRGVIALTKADAADADSLAVTQADVQALVAGSFLEDAPVIPVSVRTEQGLDELRAALVALAGYAPRLHRTGLARLPVDRVFTVKGFGTVVTGTLVSGSIAVGEELTVVPTSASARVRGLQIHGSAATEVQAPERVAVNLANVEVSALHRGLTLAAPGSLCVTRHADVRIRLLADARALAHGARVRLHHGTGDGFARVSIAAVRMAGDADWQPAQPGDTRVVISPGGEALARFRFERPAVLTRGDRIIIRGGSPVGTIGGAVVLDPEPRPGGVRRPSVLAGFRRIDSDEEDAARFFLAQAEGKGLRARDLVRRGGVDARHADALLRTFTNAGDATAAGDGIFDRVTVENVRARLTKEVAAFHLEQPGEAGMPRETLRAKVAARIASDLVEFLLTDLVAANVLRGGDRIALATFQPRKSADVDRLRTAIDTRLRTAGLAPPEAAELSAELGVAGEVMLDVIQGMVRDAVLVRVGGMAFHAEALSRLKADVIGLRGGQAAAARVTLDVASFKTKYGLSRKHAIPLLEWLDRERVTRRVGDVRLVL